MDSSRFSKLYDNTQEPFEEAQVWQDFLARVRLLLWWISVECGVLKDRRQAQNDPYLFRSNLSWKGFHDKLSILLEIYKKGTDKNALKELSEDDQRFLRSVSSESLRNRFRGSLSAAEGSFFMPYVCEWVAELYLKCLAEKRQLILSDGERRDSVSLVEAWLADGEKPESILPGGEEFTALFENPKFLKEKKNWRGSERKENGRAHQIEAFDRLCKKYGFSPNAPKQNSVLETAKKSESNKRSVYISFAAIVFVVFIAVLLFEQTRVPGEPSEERDMFRDPHTLFFGVEAGLSPLSKDDMRRLSHFLEVKALYRADSGRIAYGMTKALVSDTVAEVRRQVDLLNFQAAREMLAREIDTHSGPTQVLLRLIDINIERAHGYYLEEDSHDEIDAYARDRIVSSIPLGESDQWAEARAWVNWTLLVLNESELDNADIGIIQQTRADFLASDGLTPELDLALAVMETRAVFLAEGPNGRDISRSTLDKLLKWPVRKAQASELAFIVKMAGEVKSVLSAFGESEDRLSVWTHQLVSGLSPEFWIEGAQSESMVYLPALVDQRGRTLLLNQLEEAKPEGFVDRLILGMFYHELVKASMREWVVEIEASRQSLDGKVQNRQDFSGVREKADRRIRWLEREYSELAGALSAAEDVDVAEVIDMLNGNISFWRIVHGRVMRATLPLNQLRLESLRLRERADLDALSKVLSTTLNSRSKFWSLRILRDLTPHLSVPLTDYERWIQFPGLREEDGLIVSEFVRLVNQHVDLANLEEIDLLHLTRLNYTLRSPQSIARGLEIAFFLDERTVLDQESVEVLIARGASLVLGFGEEGCADLIGAVDGARRYVNRAYAEDNEFLMPLARLTFYWLDLLDQLQLDDSQRTKMRDLIDEEDLSIMRELLPEHTLNGGRACFHSPSLNAQST